MSRPVVITPRSVLYELTQNSMTKPYFDKVHTDVDTAVTSSGLNNTTNPITVTIAYALDVEDVIRVDREYMQVTATGASNSKTLSRGFGGSKIASHADATKIYKANFEGVVLRAIQEAMSRIEQDARTYLIQQVIKSRPLDNGLVRGTNYDIVEDAYDFNRDAFLGGFAETTLRKRPVISVERTAVRYPDKSAVITWPVEWQVIDARMGKLHLIPLTGSSSVTLLSAVFTVPLIAAAFQRGHVPNVMTIDYTAGFLPKTFDAWIHDPLDTDTTKGQPDFDSTELLKAVRYLATSDILRKVERGVMPGGGALGGDGLSQSFPSARFQQEAGGYEQRAIDIIQRWNRIEGPFQGFVI